MRALSSIVVGIDFSECSRVALIHALRMASWSNAALHPVHVIETTTLDYVDDEAGLGPQQTLQHQIHDSLVEEATRRWQAFAEVVPSARGLAIEVFVGSRLAGIRRQLERHAADLLVLGAFGAGKPHVGLGTVASGCIRGVPIDVLVVRDNYREAFHTVAVGIDFSEESRSALESAALVAHHDHARLHAVHVAPDDAHNYARLQSELEPRLRDFVADATARYPGLDARCHMYPCAAYRSGILEFASLVNADLVVIGARGRTRLRDVVLGSTAEKVLRDSIVAVWTAKAARSPTG